MKNDELQKEGVVIPPELQQQVTVTTLDKIYNWSRSKSLWPMMFGLACCAIEMICTAASRFDIARFGMEVMRPSPRQADVMIVAGTVTKENGAHDCQALQPDGRTALRHCHGKLCFRWRTFQGRVQCRSGN